MFICLFLTVGVGAQAVPVGALSSGSQASPVEGNSGQQSAQPSGPALKLPCLEWQTTDGQLKLVSIPCPADRPGIKDNWQGQSVLIFTEDPAQVTFPKPDDLRQWENHGTKIRLAAKAYYYLAVFKDLRSTYKNQDPVGYIDSLTGKHKRLCEANFLFAKADCTANLKLNALVSIAIGEAIDWGWRHICGKCADGSLIGAGTVRLTVGFMNDARGRAFRARKAANGQHTGPFVVDGPANLSYEQYQFIQQRQQRWRRERVFIRPGVEIDRGPVLFPVP